MKLPAESPLSYGPLLASVVRRSGISVVFAMVLGYAVSRVYEDLGKRNETLVDLVRDQVRESRAVTSSLVSLSANMERALSALERMERDRKVD